MAKIHPTAVVEDGAILADDCEIGPLCFVGSNVTIGAGTKLIAQCHVSGYTTIGENNTIYPFASLGCDAQDRIQLLQPQHDSFTAQETAVWFPEFLRPAYSQFRWDFPYRRNSCP